MSDEDRLSDEARENFAQFERESAEQDEKWIERLGLDEAQAESWRNHSKKWILLDGQPVAVPLLEWAQWNEAYPEHKIVGRDTVVSPGGREFRVSTVFLGIDHSFGMVGPPILFETMIFDDIRIGRRLDRWRNGEKVDHDVTIRYDGWTMRYATIDEAEAGHALTIRMVREGREEWT